MLAFSLILTGCSFLPGDLGDGLDDWAKKGDVKVPKNIKKDLEEQSQINKFSDHDELASFLEEKSLESGYGYGGYSGQAVLRSMPMSPTASLGMEKNVALDSVSEAMGATDTSVGYGDEGAEDHSETNIQVKGVDEADIIKNDGRYVYAVVKNNLYIIEAYPPEEAKVLTKIEFKSRPSDIYLNDDKLVIFGRDSDILTKEVYKGFNRRYNYTFFKVFDISNKKQPKEVRDLDFEGNYSDSRMIGDYVYFVTNYNNYSYIPTDPILPRVLEDGEVLAQDCEGMGRCFAPEVYYFNVPYDRYNFVTVTAINTKNDQEDIKGEVYVLSGNQNMYVSKDDLYITYTKRVSEYQLVMAVMQEVVFPDLSKKNREMISEIKRSPSYILTENEKMEKIGRIVERHTLSLSDEEKKELEDRVEEEMKNKYESLAKEMEKTVIHKVSINKGELEYKAQGEVTGNVLNQFSMDENNGYFRIATTKNRTWSRYTEDGEELESYSNLYVLDDDLKVVGSVEELARGERIYSVRFMQDRAYMVTFKQVDPLFVIDLKNPMDPKVLGELKIPGFSNYLHPYDNELLIGLGKETKQTEWGGVRELGVKLSLFDVSNVSEPKEVDTYVMGDAGSNSIALRDHKAFLFSKDKNLLVLPVTIREDVDGRGWGKMTFSGAAVFDADEEGFELKGKIDHSENPSSDLQEEARDCWRGYCYYDNNVLRSLYMDDVIYTFSNNYLKMNKLEDLDTLKMLEIKKERVDEDDEYEIIN